VYDTGILAAVLIKKLKNSMAWVHERTIPTDDRFSAKLVLTFADRGATWSAWQIPTSIFSIF
jgi:hypothetical protein